jgi:hypothetical protein
MWLSVFQSYFGLTAAQKKVKEIPREKVTGGGIQRQSRWRVCLLIPLLHLGMIRTIVHIRSPSPPPPMGHTPWEHWRPQCWTSVMASVWRLWVHELILDSDGDCFLLLPLGCLWAEILTAIVWQSSVKSWQAPIFCPCQYLWHFPHGGALQCRRESAHKGRGASSNSTLGDCTWRVQHLLGEVGEHHRGLGEVSCCGLCRAKTVRRCLCACANILLTPRFCRLQYYVYANILSTPIFCRRQCFVEDNIFSMQTICQRQYFVDANILLTPIFCWRQYFVAANILSVFRF